MKKLVLSIFVLAFCFALPGNSQAETKVDFSAYARSGFQVGGGLQKESSLVPANGFAISNRLQEGQYFEIGSTAHLASDSRFVLTLANGGDSFHYTNDWSGSAPFVVRNLYFAIDKLPDAPGVSAWFGSRMYRGKDIYLFDTWPVDNQNLLGGGMAFGDSTRVEFALGAKNEAAWTAVGANVFTTSTGHRYFLINKIETPLAGEKKLKTNLEFQYLPKTNGLLNGANVDTPAEQGVFGALQYDIFGTNTVFVHYGYGSVVMDKFETDPVASLYGPPNVPAALVGEPELQSRSGAHFAGGGLSNGVEMGEWGILYSGIFQYQKPRNDTQGVSFSTAVRPMYYLTNHLHAGAELDGVHYFKKISDASDVGYFQFSPMLEYALNKNVYGSPKLRLIASEIFYARNQTRNGESVKRAWNVGLGFEVWL